MANAGQTWSISESSVGHDGSVGFPSGFCGRRGRGFCGVSGLLGVCWESVGSLLGVCWRSVVGLSIGI